MLSAGIDVSISLIGALSPRDASFGEWPSPLEKAHWCPRTGPTRFQMRSFTEVQPEWAGHKTAAQERSPLLGPFSTSWGVIGTKMRSLGVHWASLDRGGMTGWAWSQPVT